LGNARDFTGTDRRLVIRHRDPERFCALWAAIAIRPREQVQDWIGAAVPRPRRYERAPGPAAEVEAAGSLATIPARVASNISSSRLSM